MLENYPVLLAEMMASLAHLGIARSEIRRIDHLCIRTESLHQYEALRDYLKGLGNILLEEPVANRPILVMELDRPLRWEEYAIRFLEMAAPKKGSPYRAGLEHADLTVGDLEKFLERHKGLHLDTGAMYKDSHPELSLKLPGQLNAKFSSQSLGEYARRTSDLQPRVGSTSRL